MQDQMKILEIKEKKLQTAKRNWQLKRNSNTQKYERDYEKLQELYSGLQQTLKENFSLKDELEMKVKIEEQKLKELQNEHDQLEQVFQSIQEQYLSIIESYTPTGKEVAPPISSSTQIIHATPLHQQ